MSDKAPEVAARVREGNACAVDSVEAALARVEADAPYNAFTDVLGARARATAQRIDARRAAGDPLGPLAGVPFAVKNLFDIRGIATRAGALVHTDQAPASADATAIVRLEVAGAVLVGALNMDEYACGFTTENTHYGAVRNPHDETRSAGGSSGGSAAAVAGGLVPLALGSDTNGSIRVPASACGVYGLKPTYGRLSRHGTQLFAESLDHIGPLGLSPRDLALAYDAMQGADPADPVATPRPPEPALGTLDDGVAGLRVALAQGFFAEHCDSEGLALAEDAAEALGAAGRRVVPEGAALGWAASLIITLAEGGNRHLKRLRTRPNDFDPLTLPRFLAGALVPATAYLNAQATRRWYAHKMRAVFEEIDLLITPGTPFPAPQIGQTVVTVAGTRLETRGQFGRFTQPISVIGLPAIMVPMARAGGMPRGVQIVAAPWREDLVLRAARALEAKGLAQASVKAAP